jgi:hypothetical protein
MNSGNDSAAMKKKDERQATLNQMVVNDGASIQKCKTEAQEYMLQRTITEEKSRC